MALLHVKAPFPQVVVHLHREHRQVLVQVEVYGSGRVEARVGVYYVALGLCQSDCWGRGQAQGTGNNMKSDVLHHLVCERRDQT